MIEEEYLRITEGMDYFLAEIHSISKMDLFSIRYLSDVFSRYNMPVTKDWVIDFSCIESIDSSTIGLIVKQGFIMGKEKKFIKMIGVRESIQRVFKMDGFERFLQFYSDRFFI